MTEPVQVEPKPPPPSPAASPKPAAPVAPPRRGRFSILRADIPAWQGVVMGVLCLVVCFGLWWWLTAGDKDHAPIIGPETLPGPAATFTYDSLHGLWFDRELTRNTLVSLKRVVLGFALAVLVGVPLGVLCGCFRRINAFFGPLLIVGRNIPIAAVIPLTFALFGTDEFQKVMFIFIACVAFIIMDTANSIMEVSSRYVDTAYTLGANRWQIVLKVLVPLSMPGIFNSLRLLFGLAFGYIMLAEQIKYGDEAGGLGDLINVSEHRHQREHILLVLMIIPMVALAVDRVLFWIQRQLFPYQYGGDGVLHQALRAVMRVCEDLKLLIVRPARWEPAATGTGKETPSKPEWKP
jgi:ABC-type nitrate/sulfonate/bicarbonate transport system permease component